MLRDKLMHHEPVDGFRWRSHEISRVEGFSDAVFGFAVTLLIVSLEVPRTSSELLETMQGFGAFVVTFFMLASLWYSQFTFFRRYGLEDRVTVLLNLVLLFMVLFFVYPLKFLFSVMLGDPRMRQKVETPHGLAPVILPEHKPLIFAIFGAGFVGVMLLFAVMYWHAYRKRQELGLNEFEVYETQHTIRRALVAVGIGTTYFMLAFVEQLPHHTPKEKQIALAASLAILAIMLVLLGLLLRLVRHRKRVTKDWKARLAEQREEPPHQ
jgi:low temperature requirement protein LtrA